MSIDLMRLAYTKDIDAKSQRVLIILCDFANDHGICWPTVDRIAWKLGVSERTVHRAISDLESRNVLTVVRRHRRNNVYRISLDKLPDKLPFVPKNEDSLGDILSDSENIDGVLGDKMSGLGDILSDLGRQNVTPTPIEPPITTTTPPPPSNVTTIAHPAQQPHAEKPKSRSRKTSDPNFDRFWDAYPNTDEKKKAVEIWAKLKPNDELVETILAAVERQKKTRKWQEGFVKVAFRWLRDENWTDGGVKETPPTGPAGVQLLPGEVAKETEPGHWELSRGDQKRYVSPEWHGVVWDPNVYRGSDGTKAFREAVADAKRKHEQEAA